MKKPIESETTVNESSAFFIPTIDMGDPDVAKQLSTVCSDVGFFYLEGHGLGPEELDEVFRESRAMFALPIDEKRKLVDNTMSRGYTAMQNEKCDPARQTEGDTKEGYYIGRDIPTDDPRYDPRKFRGPNQWPKKSILPQFQATMEEYHTKLSNLAMDVIRLIAISLGLKESHFDEAFEDSMATLRLLHYSPRKSNPERGIYGCGAHSDYGIVTLLLTDEHPGLQIYHKEEWIDVPPRPDSFVVNIGDMLEIWTNGRYKSTLHRVLTTSDCERYSIPFFFDPKFETVVKCLESCTDENNPPRYPPTTMGQHLFSKYEQTHADFDPTEEQ